jgi:hypothetical protein
MSKVIMADAVSLDGFLADEQDGVGPLHDFYVNGDTPIKGGRDTFYLHFKTSPATARDRPLSGRGLGAYRRDGDRAPVVRHDQRLERGAGRR